MVFARKRRRRRRDPAVGRVMTGLLAVCLVIYLVTASAAGKWLAEEVMKPAFTALGEMPIFRPRTSEPQPSSQPRGDALSVSLSTDSSAVTSQIKAPVMECFALQMGAFSSEENARALSSRLKEKGAGGYILEDGNRFRVLASAYESEEEAEIVKHRLTEDGLDCTVYSFSSPSVVFNVTANQEQIESIKSGLSALAEAQSRLCAACIDFDKKSMTPSEGAAMAADIKNSLYTDCQGLYRHRDDSPIMASLASCCDSCIASLSGLSDGSFSDPGEFSAHLKHSMLQLSHAYCKMMKEAAA